MTMTAKKKTTIGAVAAIAAAAIALGGGTYAFFSSTGTDKTTTASAGTLQLNDTWEGNFTLSNLAPGSAAQQNKVTLTNGGTLDGNLSFLTTIANHEDGCTGDESVYDSTCTPGPDGELSQKLFVTVKKDGVEVYSGPVSGLPGALATPVKVPAGQTVVYTFDYFFPDSGSATDNAAQGDSATITAKATLKQS